MQLEQVDYSVDDSIATITLNRPDKMNAFTSRMVHETVAALDAADADDDVRAVIVTGAGRAFCAGADLAEAGVDTFKKTSAPYEPGSSTGKRSDHVDEPGSSTGSVDNKVAGSTAKRSDHVDEPGSSTGSVDNKAARDGGGIVSLRLFQCLKPVIGAVNGVAVGVGSTMLLPMDIRLASTEARFGFVFTQRGIVPEAASSWFLPRVVGISRALEWCYSGKVFDAQEALEGGLVRSLHEPEDLLPAAREIATQIAENTSSVAVAMTRQQLWRMLGADHPMQAHQVESAAVPQLGAMADVAEGISSFFEKRPPHFTLKPSTDMPAVYPWFEEPDFIPYT